MIATPVLPQALGTGDSPQFAGVNIGAAADTTITRVSAGLIAVEGSNLIRASDVVSATADGIVSLATLHAIALCF